ncbi:MAG: 50S ribosomal protein L11 methyltransferase [Myxococcales bacterium]|nr:50S ribosomal protein L11 methyltransferase [Myxococcales bacterium]
MSEPRFPYVEVDVAAELAEVVAVLLFELGASGVETRDDTTTPRGPGLPLVRLVASFDEHAHANDAAAELRRVHPDLAFEVNEIVGDAWRDAYKQFFAPFSLTNSIVVVPPWVSEHVLESGQTRLVMDPGRAFGTGLHATTQLVAARLEELAPVLAGGRVLDVGTGSGVLALVALLLGAERALAIDNDPDVIDVALENAERNGLAARLSVETTPIEAVVGEYSVVLANIQANVLIAMADALAARLVPGGMLVLSGVLHNQEADVRAAFVERGLIHITTTARGDGADAWVSLSLMRPA